MDLFEKQAEKLGHKLHETKSNNTADGSVDFIKEIDLERLAKFTKAWIRFHSDKNEKKVDLRVRSSTG